MACCISYTSCSGGNGVCYRPTSISSVTGTYANVTNMYDGTGAWAETSTYGTISSTTTLILNRFSTSSITKSGTIYFTVKVPSYTSGTVSLAYSFDTTYSSWTTVASITSALSTITTYSMGTGSHDIANLWVRLNTTAPTAYIYDILFIPS